MIFNRGSLPEGGEQGCRQDADKDEKGGGDGGLGADVGYREARA